MRRDTQPGVDSTSIINPNAFRYVEKRSSSRPQPAEPAVDSRPIVNPQAFKWIERPTTTTRTFDEGPDVDERSYVNPQAFRYIDRHVAKKREPVAAEIDQRSYILDRNPRALAHLERNYTKTQNQVEGGVDERPYVNPDAFKFIEGLARDPQTRSIHSAVGPTIDTRSYVNTESFRHLENRRGSHWLGAEGEGDETIDERSYVPTEAFRHLEFSEQPMSSYRMNYTSHGLSDV